MHLTMDWLVWSRLTRHEWKQLDERVWGDRGVRSLTQKKIECKVEQQQQHKQQQQQQHKKNQQHKQRNLHSAHDTDGVNDVWNQWRGFYMGHFIPGPIKPITWRLHCLHWFSLIFIFFNFFRRLLFVSLFSWAPPINPITWMLCIESVALIFTHFPSRGAGSPFYQPNHLINESRFPLALELEIPSQMAILSNCLGSLGFSIFSLCITASVTVTHPWR